MNAENIQRLLKFERMYPVKENKHHGPDARSGHRIVVNDSDIYCYGGYNPTPSSGGDTISRNMDEFPMFRELWKFNLASRQWKILPTTGTPPMESASYACILIHNSLYILGGTGFPFAEVRSNVMYRCDLNNLHWSSLQCTGTPPKRVYGHSMLYLNGCIYLFGGTTGFFYNCDMFRLDLASKEWERICHPPADSPAPSARYRHEMATDGNLLYVFGGGTSISAEPLDVVWTFDIRSNQWTSLETTADEKHGYPEPRKCHGCVQRENYVYITGGLGDGNRPTYRDIWRFDMRLREWKKLEILLPKEVYFHATAISPAGSLYTFGGVLTRRQENRRAKGLYRVDVNTRSLTELSWEQLIKNKYIHTCSRLTLLSLGIPRHFLSRIDLPEISPMQPMVA